MVADSVNQGQNNSRKCSIRIKDSPGQLMYQNHRYYVCRQNLIDTAGRGMEGAIEYHNTHICVRAYTSPITSAAINVRDDTLYISRPTLC